MTFKRLQYYEELKTTINLVESGYDKYISNNSNHEINSKINNISIILARLGNIMIKN